MKERLFIGILSLALAAPLAPVFAGRTAFEPSLSFGYSYTDNVQYQDADDSSDQSARLGLALALSHQERWGTLSLSYGTGFSKFDTFDELDNLSHSFSFGLDADRGLRSLGFSAYYTLSQDQGQTESLEDLDLFLTERTTRELYGASLSYGRRLRSERWNWGLSLGASDSSYDDIDDFSTPMSTLQTEDRSSFSGSVSFDRVFTRTTSGGLSYRLLSDDLDLSGDSKAHSLGFTLSHTVSDRVQLAAQLGAYQRSSDTLAEDPSGIQGNVSLQRTYRSVKLGLSARHGASSGGALRGTSLDTSVGISLAPTSAVAGWTWSTAARWGHRDPDEKLSPTVQSVGLSAGTERKLARTLGLRLGGSISDQSGDSISNNGSFYKVSVGLAWYPIGRRRELLP